MTLESDLTPKGHRVQGFCQESFRSGGSLNFRQNSGAAYVQQQQKERDGDERF